jgi:hypothetical protein
LRRSPHDAAIEGRPDLDYVAIFHPAAVDKETVGSDWGDGHFRHLGLRGPNGQFSIIGPRLGLPSKEMSEKEER